MKWTSQETHFGFSVYKFKVNKPPSIEGASCGVLPLEGTRLTTKFKTISGGIIDEDAPLTYYFYYSLRKGGEKFLIGYKTGIILFAFSHNNGLGLFNFGTKLNLKF